MRPIPADVRDARDRLATQIKAAIGGKQKRDTDQTEQSLQSAEDTLAVIENYLGRYVTLNLSKGLCRSA